MFKFTEQGLRGPRSSDLSSAQLSALLGVRDTRTAANLLGSGGIPTVLLVRNGQPVGVRMEHVWVRAAVDHDPYRGVGPQGAADRWIPMDACLTPMAWTEGHDLRDAVHFGESEMGEYLQRDDLPGSVGTLEEQAAEIECPRGQLA
jgi:hypothetical protein